MPNDPHELSVRLTMDYREHRDETTSTLPRLDLFYGLFERCGADLSVPLAYHRGEDGCDYGLGDVSFALKYLVLDHAPSCPAVVVGLETTFPTGDEETELGEGVYELAPFVGLLKDFGKFSLQGNFGWSKQVSGGQADCFTYNWALAVPLAGRRVHILAEINGDFDSPRYLALAPGLKYRICDEFTVGVAVPIGLNRNTPNWGIVAQLQTEF